MESTWEKRENYLYSKVVGPFDREQAVSNFERLASECARLNCRLLLIDVTEMTGKISVINRFAMGERLMAFGSVIHRLAMVVRSDQVLPDKFMQLVARNRGFNAAPFLSFSEAEAWLLEGNKTAGPQAG